MNKWREAFYSYQRERLDIRDRGEYLDIIDLRKCNKKRYYHLRGLEKEIYLYCMQSRTKKMVKEYFEKYQTDLISKIITFFIESNLMIEMNEAFLSLGLLPISGRYPHISEAPGGCVHNSAV